MTNEEKARDLCMAIEPPYIDFIQQNYKTALQMAEWKNEQMKEALNNILIECDACFDEQTTNTLESIIKHQISLL